MDITEIIHELRTNLSAYDIHLSAPADANDFASFERQFHFELPEDVKLLYQFCNGFESDEDIFRIIPLTEMKDRQPTRPHSFYFAEYMTYCDIWEINVNPSAPDTYSISNPGDTIRTLTNSIGDFLSRFLTGGVFGKGGLYEWHEEIDDGVANRGQGNMSISSQGGS